MNNKIEKRIFIISEYVVSNENSTGYYWSKIINGLSLNFKNIYVICPEPGHVVKNKKNNQNVKYIYVRKVAHNKNRLLSRLYGQIVQSCLFFYVLFRNIRVGDIIFSGTNPAPSLVLISLLKIFRPFSWLLLVHDVFPENLVAAQVIRKKNIVYGFIKAIYDGVYSAPTVLIAIGRDMKIKLAEKTKSKSEIIYIPNWADANDIIPLKNSCSAIEKTGKVVFQFFGNLGRLQGIGNVINAIKLTKTKTAIFEFIGYGSEIGSIQDFIKNNPAIAISYKPGVPFGSGNEILSECDVAIVSLATGMNGLGVPSKSYFSLAADKIGRAHV